MLRRLFKKKPKFDTKKPDGTAYFEKNPAEVTGYMLEYLKPIDVVQLENTSKRMRAVIQKAKVLERPYWVNKGFPSRLAFFQHYQIVKKLFQSTAQLRIVIVGDRSLAHQCLQPLSGPKPFGLEYNAACIKEKRFVLYDASHLAIDAPSYRSYLNNNHLCILAVTSQAQYELIANFILQTNKRNLELILITPPGLKLTAVQGNSLPILCHLEVDPKTHHFDEFCSRIEKGLANRLGVEISERKLKKK